MQTYLEAQQDLSTLLEQARRDGAVRIQSKEGQTFVLKPEDTAPSPLDVKGVDLNLSRQEIIEFIHESRKRF